jgi:hypothetical protein
LATQTAVEAGFDSPGDAGPPHVRILGGRVVDREKAPGDSVHHEREDSLG